jgi:type IV pilus assembly protein PilV
MLSMRPLHRSNRRVPTLPPKASIRGVGLIEVLVSLLVFSMGVLGLVGLQARAVQMETQAGDRTRAANLANEVVTQMWVNRSAKLSSTDLEAWNTRASAISAGGLPEGEVTVSDPDADGVVTIKIAWRPPTRQSEGAEPMTYLTQVVIP